MFKANRLAISHSAIASLNSSRDANYCDNNDLLNNFDLSDHLSITIHDSINPCEYYEINNIPIVKSYKGLFFIHINIRSTQTNFDCFCELSELSYHPQIICLSETKIKDKSVINISLPGYIFIHANSSTNAKGCRNLHISTMSTSNDADG